MSDLRALSRDIRILLLTRYLSLRDVNACLLSHRLFHVLSEPDRLRLYSRSICQKNTQRLQQYKEKALSKWMGRSGVVFDESTHVFCDACWQVIRIARFEAHATDHCAPRRICTLCSGLDKKGHVCLNTPVNCTKPCSFIGTPWQLEQHRHQCDHATWECLRCKQKMCKSHTHQHFLELCTTFSCRFNCCTGDRYLSTTYSDRNTHERQRCPKVVELARDVLSKIPRRTHPAHHTSTSIAQAIVHAFDNNVIGINRARSAAVDGIIKGMKDENDTWTGNFKRVAGAIPKSHAVLIMPHGAITV